MSCSLSINEWWFQQDQKFSQDGKKSQTLEADLANLFQQFLHSISLCCLYLAIFLVFLKCTLFQTSGEEEVLEEDEEIEEDRKEEREMQKSPDPPAIPLVGPIDLPALQSLSLSSSSFICEMPNCGAVRAFHIFK